MKTFSSPLPLSLPLALGVIALVFAGCDNDDKAKVADATVANQAVANSATRPSTSSSTTATVPSRVQTDSSQPVASAVAPVPPAPPAPPEPAAPLVTSMTPPAPAPVAPGIVNPPAVVPQNPPPASHADAWEEIKDYTYTQKADLVTRVEGMTSEFDTSSAAVRDASPKTEFADTRSADLTALEDARLVLTQKRDALQYATADTWLSAKTEFRSAWKNARLAYDKVKNESN